MPPGRVWPISTPNWRDRSCTGCGTQKPQTSAAPHACAPPSIAGQVPGGPAVQSLAWGKRGWLEPSSPAFTTGPSTATFFSASCGTPSANRYRSCSDLYAQLARQKLHRLVTQKPQNDLTLTVHRWPSPSGPAGKAWPGENVDEPSSPAFTTGPSTATFFSKLSVMFRSSLDTSIKPILCPRKSGPTHRDSFVSSALRVNRSPLIPLAGPNRGTKREEYRCPPSPVRR